MEELSHLFENNRRWVAQVTAKDSEFFQRLSGQQTPKYLWIGCADSRVPANEIVGLLPGELFVHRNISNVVAQDDLNCLSVIQFAVDVLKVRHIIVCGHFGCGGVQAALEDRSLGLSDEWLKYVRGVRDKHLDQLGALAMPGRFDRLCELNGSSGSPSMDGSMPSATASCVIWASASLGPRMRHRNAKLRSGTSLRL
jgi:carbonic anhydrase